MEEQFRYRVILNDKLIVDKLNKLKEEKIFKNDTEMHRKIYEIGVNELYQKYFNQEEYYRQKLPIQEKTKENKEIEFMFRDLTYVASNIQIIKELIASLVNIEILKLEDQEIEKEDIENGSLSYLPEIYKEMENLIEEKLNQRYKKLK